LIGTKESGHLQFRVRNSILLIIFALAFAGTSFCPGVTKQVEISPKTAQEKQAAELLIEGTHLLKEKKPFKARKVLEQSAQLWPGSAVIHYNLGCGYNECALYEQAVTEFKRALELDPKMTDCLVNLGSCYQVQGRTDEAIDFFHGYLKKNSHSTDAETIRGMIRALEKYKREHVESDPNAPDYLSSVCDEGCVRRWPVTRIPLAVYISNGTDEGGKLVRGFREEFNYILYGALEDWAKASHYKLSFRIVPDPNQADLACTWTDDPAFILQGNKVEQGVARVYAETKPGTDGTKAIRSSQVRILVTKHETGDPLTSDDMKKTCLHEIGHALGIVEHSPSNRDVMFYSNSNAVWPSLTKRDKATILRMYQDFPERPPASPPASGPHP
jgi:hypothetical protein